MHRRQIDIGAFDSLEEPGPPIGWPPGGGQRQVEGATTPSSPTATAPWLFRPAEGTPGPADESAKARQRRSTAASGASSGTDGGFPADLRQGTRATATAAWTGCQAGKEVRRSGASAIMGWPRFRPTVSRLTAGDRTKPGEAVPASLPWQAARDPSQADANCASSSAPGRDHLSAHDIAPELELSTPVRAAS